MWTNLAAKISSEGCFLLSGVISTNALSGNTSVDRESIYDREIHSEHSERLTVIAGVNYTPFGMDDFLQLFIDKLVAGGCTQGLGLRSIAATQCGNSGPISLFGM